MIAEDETRHRAAFRVDRTHPALPGHFPGNPIVPGVLVLAEVIRAAEAAAGQSLRVHALPTVKFLAPLRPDDAAVVEFVRRSSTWSFDVRCGEVTIAKGVLAADAAGPA